MEPFRTMLVTSVLVVLLPYYGDAIRCYDCNSKTDQGCEGPIVDTKYVKDCAEGIQGSKYTLCRKISQWIDFKSQDMEPNKRVIRTCGWEDKKYVNECYYRAGLGGRQEVCTCIDDGCNHGSTMTLASFIMASTLMLVLWRLLE